MKSNKMMRMLVIAVFAALLVAMPLAAVDGCQEKTGCEKKMKAEGCEKMKGEGCMMLKQIPNLSEEQKGKLEKLHAEHMKAMAAAMAEMQKKCQEHCQAMRDLLTDEQKAKLPEMGSCMMGGKHMEGKEGKGCMEKQAQAKHECQKKETEEKK